MTIKKTKFLDATEIDRGIMEIAAITQGAPPVLIGGAALQLYGSDRLTKDIDVVIAEAGQIVPLPPLRQLPFGGFGAVTASGVPVDVIQRSDRYWKLYAEAWASALPIEGVPIPVVRPEHLAAMKMQAGRDKDDLDLKFLILSGSLDMDLVRSIIGQFLGPYAEEEFDQLVAVTQWQASRG